MGLFFRGLGLLLGSLFTKDLVLLAVSVGFSFEGLGTGSFKLKLDDGFHQNSLVLVHVTLDLVVQFTVQVLIDLLLGSVLLQKSAKDSDAAHPQSLFRHTSVSGTSTATETRVSTKALSSISFSYASSGVDLDGLLDNQTIIEQLANVLA